jgi:putative flippase GtrA
MIGSLWSKSAYTHAKSFVIFSIVGLGAAGVYFGTLAVFLEYLRLDYRIAVSASYFLGVIFHFLVNKLVTFKDRTPRAFVGQALRYLVLVLVNYILTIAVVTLVVERIGYPPYVGVVFSMCLTVVTGYLVARYWIFGQR